VLWRGTMRVSEQWAARDVPSVTLMLFCLQRSDRDVWTTASLFLVHIAQNLCETISALTTNLIQGNEV